MPGSDFGEVTYHITWEAVADNPGLLHASRGDFYHEHDGDDDDGARELEEFIDAIAIDLLPKVAAWGSWKGKLLAYDLGTGLNVTDVDPEGEFQRLTAARRPPRFAALVKTGQGSVRGEGYPALILECHEMGAAMGNVISLPYRVIRRKIEVLDKPTLVRSVPNRLPGDGAAQRWWER
ncbi:MAG: hypothetical protein Q4G35_01995 [Propionibacteriaceae bacterium]|nr:hypothetical protein [Propionibacteriaceae bacterium]